MKYKKTLVAFIVLCSVGLITFRQFNQPSPPLVEANQQSIKQSKKQTVTREPKRRNLQELPVIGLAKAQTEVPGSIRRKAPGTVIDRKLLAEREVIETEGYGTYPPVDMTEMNDHKKHVMAALKDPVNNSGSISIVGQREKFDPERYKSDPDYYLKTVEPGRAFDAAAPGPDTKPLERVGYASIRTVQNKTVELTAKGVDGMPVSFTAFDGGHFQNGLSFITVKADANGTATARFTPTTGVINQARIRAASPVNTGTLQWTVYVRLNQDLSNNN